MWIPMNSYEMAFLKTKYTNLYFLKQISYILKASFCHSLLLKDNKVFNLKKNFLSYSNFSCHIIEQTFFKISFTKSLTFKKIIVLKLLKVKYFI